MIKTMFNKVKPKYFLEELSRLMEVQQKVTLYITAEFTPVGYIESVEQDFVRFRDLFADNDQYVTVPVDNICYVRERK